MVRPSGGHDVCAQQAPDLIPGGQHALAQQGGAACGRILAPLTGTGQHGMIMGRCCGQITRGERGAAPAEPAMVKAENAAAAAAARRSS